VIIFLLSDHDWSGLEYYRGGLFGYMFSVIPYLWLVVLFLLIIAAYGDFRKTKDGYRYGSFWVVGGVIALSFIFGFGFYAMGVGRITDELLAEKMPPYRKMVINGHQMWNRPHEGYLFGKVIVIEPGYLFLVTPDKSEWRVRPVGQEASLFMQKIDIDSMVRCIGKSNRNNIFDAEIIMPWQTRMHLYRSNGIIKPFDAYKQSERSMRLPVHSVAPDFTTK
jgi:hypothetical protein